MSKQQTHQNVASDTKDWKVSGGRNATHQADERDSKGLGLFPLVAHDETNTSGMIRKSRNKYLPVGNFYALNEHGIAVSKTQWIDGSGSFGRAAVNSVYNGYKKGYLILMKAAPGFDWHCGVGIFNDARDCQGYTLGGLTQYEYGPEIFDQLSYLHPNDNGSGNNGEESQYALFQSAYLNWSTCWRWYGKKGYVFVATDEPYHYEIERSVLQSIYGKKLFEVIQKNGHEQYDWNNLPTIDNVVADLLVHSNVFVFHRHNSTYPHGLRMWQNLLGKERVISVQPDDFEVLEVIRAAVVGLTEGTLSLATVADFMTDEGKLGKSRAGRIALTLCDVPVGVNNPKPGIIIPKPGEIFETLDSPFPMDVQPNLSDIAKEGQQSYDWML